MSTSMSALPQSGHDPRGAPIAYQWQSQFSHFIGVPKISSYSSDARAPISETTSKSSTTIRALVSDKLFL